MKKMAVLILTVLLTSTFFVVTVHAALTQTQASQLYASIFGRASEGEGNAYWCENQNDMTIAADTMLATGAAQSYFGTTLNDNQLFIEFIYKNTLGKTRAEDPDGINYWIDELANGKSKGQVVASLINAVMDSQYTGLPAQNRFINKVDVSNYTADTIASAPDTSDLSAFVQFISNVTDDPATVTAAKADVYSKGPFKYTAEWLNGKSLYNVFFKHDLSQWVIAVFSYADGQGNAYDWATPDTIISFTYTITPDGILIMSFSDGNETEDHIKVVSQTDDYQTVCWSDSLESVMSCKEGKEYFYFDLQKAQDFVNQKNAETTSAKSELPDVSYFKNNPSDQFIVDYDDIDTTIPYLGKNAVAPHTGAHVHFDNKKYQGDPSSFPKIYAPADGTILKVDSYFPVSSPELTHYMYAIDIAFARKNDLDIFFHLAIEPFYVPENTDFYEKYIYVKAGDRVKKGDVIASMYLPEGIEGASHIHFSIIDQSITVNDKQAEPNIFSEDVVSKFSAKWSSNVIESETLDAPCMSCKLAEGETLF